MNTQSNSILQDHPIFSVITISIVMFLVANFVYCSLEDKPNKKQIFFLGLLGGPISLTIAIIYLIYGFLGRESAK